LAVSVLTPPLTCWRTKGNVAVMRNLAALMVFLLQRQYILLFFLLIPLSGLHQPYVES
jgi:hypothetical protein